jgi:predicted Zn-dependent protease
VQVTATRAAGLGVVPQAPVARDRAAFLAEIEGMLLGADPAKGACVSGQFVHVDLDFLIRLPTGWRCVNQANAVLAQPAAADAQLRIELQGKGADPAEAARAFAGQNQLQLENGRAERIAGLAAYRAVARANTQQGQLGLDLTWIAHPAGMFRVLGLTSVPKFGSYAADFRAAGGSLRQLKAEERERVTELRLRVVKARAGERLEALSKRSGNAWDLATTAIANKLDPAVSLGAGQLVKIAKAEPYRRK